MFYTHICNFFPPSAKLYFFPPLRLKSLSQHPNRTNAEVATESLILVSELLGVLDLEALVDGMIVAMFPLTPSTQKATSPNSCFFSLKIGAQISTIVMMAFQEKLYRRTGVGQKRGQWGTKELEGHLWPHLQASRQVVVQRLWQKPLAWAGVVALTNPQTDWRASFPFQKCYQAM